jgi:putative membrane protein
VRFWCSQLYEEWSWVPRPYLGVWLIVIGLVVSRHRALGRWQKRVGTAGVTHRQSVWFWLGLVGFWVASDWPVGTLGAGYLLSVHMAQYLLYTFMATPLLLLSVPEWRMRQFVARTHLYGTLKLVTRVLPAVLIANVILLATHAPWTVDTLRVSQIGSFALDVVWLLGGFLLWLPVISPMKELRVASAPVRCIYLFGAAGLTPMIPGGFFTFSRYPLFSTYEIAPRIGLTALTDQQIAGAMMKVGSVPLIWVVIAVIWSRWAAEEEKESKAAIRAMHDPSAGGPAA